MKWTSSGIVGIASALLLAAISPLHAQGKSRILDAAETAREKFASELGKRKPSDWEWEKYVSNVDNYDIGLSESPELYVVVFTPREKRIRGGRYEYWVSKSDLKIVKFKGYE